MVVKENYSLKNHNTFRVDAKTRYFVEAKSEKDILEIVNNPEFKNLPKFILGDGSNTLFTKDLDGVAIKVAILGRRIIEETDNYVVVAIGAGENWHEVVSWVAENNWGGIENLALIPGTAGAAPVQNIAAYGQNFSDVFDSLDAIDLGTGELKRFTPAECEFGYRNSVFKNKLKEKALIARIRLRLAKNPQLETSYYQIGITHDSIREELAKIAAEPYTIKDVYNAVVNIRTRKLPDINQIPTVGSFFLNPIVSREKYEDLKEKVPELQSYPKSQLVYKKLDDDFFKNESLVKIAAGRLLQEIGWLGKWIGNCGIHDRHALIIVTNGKASGREILNFSEKVRQSFFDNYGIWLETEVNIV